MSDATTLDRFWAKVTITDSCWLWHRPDAYGYGAFTIRRGMIVKAHRFAYELFVGPIPDGLDLDHLCRVRHCVNPAHLEPVTRRENALRGVGPTAVNARKSHCIHGHPLTEGQGRRICRTCNAERNKAWRQRRSFGELESA